METAIIEALKCCIEDKCRDCSYSRLAQSGVCLNELHKDILDLLTKVHISISECRFGSISAFLVRQFYNFVYKKSYKILQRTRLNNVAYVKKIY